MKKFEIWKLSDGCEGYSCHSPQAVSRAPDWGPLPELPDSRIRVYLIETEG